MHVFQNCRLSCWFPGDPGSLEGEFLVVCSSFPHGKQVSNCYRTMKRSRSAPETAPETATQMKCVTKGCSKLREQWYVGRYNTCCITCSLSSGERHCKDCEERQKSHEGSNGDDVNETVSGERLWSRNTIRGQSSHMETDVEDEGAETHALPSKC